MVCEEAPRGYVHWKAAREFDVASSESLTPDVKDDIDIRFDNVLKNSKER